MQKKKGTILSAIRLWASGEGFDITLNAKVNDDFSAKKDGLVTTFITEFDKTYDQLTEKIANTKSNYIYIITDDNSKRRELIKEIPDHCGILCYSDAFGFGYLYQILKEPKLKLL